MAISDITLPADRVRKGPPCDTCSWLEALPDTEAAALRKLLADPQMRYTELENLLADEGIEIRAFSLSRHARGGCSAKERLR